jgi:hypothetical protein
MLCQVRICKFSLGQIRSVYVKLVQVVQDRLGQVKSGCHVNRRGNFSPGYIMLFQVG